jgi:hypothetical protein
MAEKAYAPPRVLAPLALATIRGATVTDLWCPSRGAHIDKEGSHLPPSDGADLPPSMTLVESIEAVQKHRDKCMAS